MAPARFQAQQQIVDYQDDSLTDTTGNSVDEENSESENYELRLKKRVLSLSEQKPGTPTKNRTEKNTIDTEGLEFIESLNIVNQSFGIEEAIEPGDFVQTVNNENDMGPLVGHVYNIWQNKNDQSNKGVLVCWFFHPWQTKHKISKTFYENEVFKTMGVQSVNQDQVIGKCYVMEPRAYSQGFPESINKNIPNFEKLVYVCDSRYCEKSTKISTIKNMASIWPHTVEKETVVRKSAIQKYANGPKVLTRVPSVFAGNTPLTPTKKDKTASTSAPKISDFKLNKTTPGTLHSSHIARKANPEVGSSYNNDQIDTSNNVLQPTPKDNTDSRDSYSFYHNFSLANGALHSNTSKTPTNATDTSSKTFKEFQQTNHKSYYSTRPSRILDVPQKASRINSQLPGGLEYSVSSIHQATPISTTNSTQSQNYSTPNTGYNQAPNFISRSSVSLQTPQSTFQHKTFGESNPVQQIADIDPEIVKYFRTDKSGRILWFATPPAAPPVIRKPVHSEAYLQWKKQKNTFS